MQIRTLPSDEWDRLLDFEPWATHGCMPAEEHWTFIVAEEVAGGEILAYTGIYNAVHWEPWYIRPEHRGRPGLVRGLIREGLTVLRENGVGAAFCLASAETAKLVEHFGFTPAPGKLYILSVQEIRVD